MRTGMLRVVSPLLGGVSLLLGAVSWTAAHGKAGVGQSARQEQGGMSTAGAHAAVLDSQNRPITAGGFAESGPVVFEEIAQKCGLTGWHHVMGTPEKTYILETVGSGVALIDYDNDGWLDIYFVNGSTYDALSGKAKSPHAALFHNNHDGTFTDMAEKAGDRLYHSNHDGTFTDVAEKGRGHTWQLVDLGDVWGLRRGRAIRSVCCGLRSLRYRASSCASLGGSYGSPIVNFVA